MRSFRRRIATHGNGFRLFLPFSGPSHLPPVATGCDRSAPQMLHPPLSDVATNSRESSG